ncbi:MAG: hypothetical protein ACTSQB_00875 [Candidatus Heimdallarchaeota archaeon]
MVDDLKETIVTDSGEQESEDIPEFSSEELEKRSRMISSSIFRWFGIFVLVLGAIIIPLLILSYFYHPGQPDETSLLIEQIVGYCFIAISLSVGAGLIMHAKNLRTRDDYVLEPIVEENEVDEVNQDTNTN